MFLSHVRPRVTLAPRMAANPKFPRKQWQRNLAAHS